jgi:hypothetical protein
MKHLKAYTFEELLNEIPELEKYRGLVVMDTYEEVEKLFLKFARSNKLKYIDTNTPFEIYGLIHFLFEKLNSPISISNYNSLESLNDLRVKRYDEEGGNNNHGSIEHFRD